MWCVCVCDDSLSAFVMRIVLLLVLLTVSHSDSRGVEGRAGESVTLTCKYDAQKHGRLSACWSRGDLSISGCNNQIISRDRPTVSSRYQLLGRLDEGDVSMTILNLTETDAGRYGCRVEIPGWFNDEKHHFDLTVDAAPQTTSEPNTGASTQTPAAQTADHMTSTDHVTSTGRVLTSSTSSTDGLVDEVSSGAVPVVLVCVLFTLIVLLTVGGAIIMARKRRRLNKMPQQQQQVNTLPTLQLQSRGSAVENIYQINEDGDGGEYEYCP
ncbi:hepatitis A virus cellular receptor 1 homolog [Seriola dumerili]|uniref:Hepatitis A virus cellular receptor 1 homolog n=1 Tax=Seriola dumerili TaxID=41447 RepID=A0A3B4VPG8_SERDU|nr:hepatitis A virus cellular receptor 1 homolog [Seriola dumerili]